MEVYLDNAATTKPRKEVVKAMLQALEEDYGNPSSLHRKGVMVEKEIKKIRRSLGKYLGCTDAELIFTSSGTEANNLAIRGIIDAYKRSGNHIITSKIEHKSVLSTFNELEKLGYDVTYIDVDSNGFVSPMDIEDAVTDRTIFVSIMQVNNEVGSIQAIEEIAKAIKKKNPKTIFHVDGIQAFGKLDVNVRDLKVDSYSISGHKIHGPKGIGALYLKKGTKITPLLFGGNQELGIRSGTENIPGIYGLGEATRVTMEEQKEKIAYIKELRDYFIDLFEENIEGIHVLSGKGGTFAPHIVNICFPGVRSEIMLHSLEQEGIYVSSGSACSSKKKGYSHVLEAMKIKHDFIDSSLRFSFSYENTKEEILYTMEKCKMYYENLKRIIKR